MKVTWDEKITEHGQQIHRVGWCSFDVEYLPTGVAKVYEFGYSNADTTWPFQGQKQVEVTDIRPTFPPEGTEFGVPGQSLRIRQGRGGDGRPRFTIDFVNPIYSGFTTIYRYTSWDGRVIAQDPVQGRTYRNAFCLQQITDVPALVGRFPPNSGSPRVRMPDVGLFKQVPYANLDVSWSFVPAGRREGAR